MNMVIADEHINYIETPLYKKFWAQLSQGWLAMKNGNIESMFYFNFVETHLTHYFGINCLFAFS